MLGEQERSIVPAEVTANHQPATDDDALAVQARRDPAAFEQLYLRYADRIFRFAVGQTRSVMAAEEIVSDTMMAAFERIERFDPSRGSFGAWVFTIARRRTADEQRRRSRLWGALRRRGAETDTSEDPLSRLIRSERAADLRAAVGRLPQQDREILLLRYVAELSGPDISAMLNLSPGAIRVRVHRALRRLSDELGDGDDARRSRT